MHLHMPTLSSGAVAAFAQDIVHTPRVSSEAQLCLHLPVCLSACLSYCVSLCMCMRVYACACVCVISIRRLGGLLIAFHVSMPKKERSDKHSETLFAIVVALLAPVVVQCTLCFVVTLSRHAPPLLFLLPPGNASLQSQSPRLGLSAAFNTKLFNATRSKQKLPRLRPLHLLAPTPLAQLKQHLGVG